MTAESPLESPLESSLEGILPIVSVPFRDDESIDVDGLAAEAAFLIDRGVIGLGVGYGSELPRLTEADRTLLTTVLVEQAAGRLPVMASVGADSTVAAIARAEAAADAGAGLLMVVPPAQPGIEPSAVAAYFAAIADRVAVPIVVQDAPSATGIRMSAQFLGQLARDIPSVISIKVEEIPSSPKIAATVREVGSDATVLGGAGGSDFFNELGRGARGTVPGACHPEIFVRMHQAFIDGRHDESFRLWSGYLPFIQLVSRSMDTFLIVQKEILRRRGVLQSNRLRSPSTSPDPRFWIELDTVLARLDEADILGY